MGLPPASPFIYESDFMHYKKIKKKKTQMKPQVAQWSEKSMRSLLARRTGPNKLSQCKPAIMMLCDCDYTTSAKTHQ